MSSREDKRDFRFLDTFNVEKVDPGFIDVSFYQSAVDAKVIEDIDYYTSRISNNPDTSNKAVLYENTRTRTASNIIGKDVTTLNSISFYEGHDVVASDIGNRETSHPLLQMELDDVIYNIVEEISTLPPKERTHLLKALAFYMVQNGVSEWCRHPYLNKFIEELRLVEESLYFKYLIKYLGSRFAAEKARDRLRDLMIKYFDIEL